MTLLLFISTDGFFLMISLDVLRWEYNRVELLAMGSLRLMSSWLILLAKFRVKGGGEVVMRLSPSVDKGYEGVNKEDRCWFCT